MISWLWWIFCEYEPTSLRQNTFFFQKTATKIRKLNLKVLQQNIFVCPPFSRKVRLKFESFAGVTLSFFKIAKLWRNTGHIKIKIKVKCCLRKHLLSAFTQAFVKCIYASVCWVRLCKHLLSAFMQAFVKCIYASVC